MRTAISKENKEKVLRLLKTMTITEVSNITNLSCASIENIKREFGANKPQQHERLKLTLQEQERIAVEYFINGTTQKALRGKYGLTQGAFSNIRKRFAKAYPQKKRGVYSERTEKIKEMLHNGLTARQITDIMGVSRQYVSQVKKQAQSF